MSLVLFVIAWPVSAVVLQDQSYSGAVSSTGQFSQLDMTFGRAQVFTVGIAGILDSVLITASNSSVSFSQMRILATSGGVPIGGAAGSTVLASSSSFISAGNDYTFDFSSAALNLGIGDQLAIEPFAPIGPGWRGNTSNTYPGGSSYFFNTGGGINNWTSSPSGYYFTTFMTVPEPAAWVMLCLGGGLICRRSFKPSQFH